jgi:hypothetical protein
MTMDDDADHIRAFMRAFMFEVEDAKQYFGQWDACDPVCWAILRVVRAQNEFAHAIYQNVCYGMSERAVEQAIAERLAAVVNLQKALEEEPRGFQ